MSPLVHYVTQKTEQTSSGDGQITVEFFDVNITAEPDAANLKTLIENHVGEFSTEINLFDDKEHNYLELGAWIGDQGMAMRMMALGSHLKLWKLMTPTSMLPELDDHVKKQMAGMGMICIQTGLTDDEE